MSQQCDAVGILGIVTEVAVGLVEEGQWRVVAESVEEGRQRRAADDRAGRVVWRAQHDGLRSRRQSAGHVVQIGLVLRQRAWNHPGGHQLDHGRVGLEGGLGDDYLVARFQGCPTDEREQFVGAVTDDDLGGGDTQPRCQRLAQRGRATVRVEVDAGGLARNRLDDARRGAERALIGRQPDQVGPAQIGGERLQWPARVIRGNTVDRSTPNASHLGIVISPRPI